jgi:2-polyprenyl-6-hydroxyphenyl methylase/3-demethylubiquinone-9 3-methyltransferase
MIDNEFYKHLGDKWHESEGDAVALLRLENKVKAPWVAEQINKYHGEKAKVLDVGCGGGFLTLQLAQLGHQSTGLDVSDSILASGRKRDSEQRIDWVVGSAEALPFSNSTYDVVTMLDVLEHVTTPQTAVAEALRVLKPNGTFIYHTFNRTWLAYLLAAKGLDWFIRDSQPHVHDWAMFIKPRELEDWMNRHDFASVESCGIQPAVYSALHLLLSRRVPNDFRFRLSRNKQVGYMGLARRQLTKSHAAL